ncbi:S-layer homology domain-containing protein, partial [Oceanithermus sp.]|uniref:S-layer homology domain-containing protein n=1 Tax=Oceanithermus sp. TaxID=2268145 RepID=UPI00258108FE
MNRTVRFVLPLLAVLGLASAQLYQDVPDGHWARNAVDEATRLGLVTGFPDGTFRGEELLNRYQAAMILYRLVQYLESRPAAAVDPATIAAMQTLLARLESELRATQTRLAELDAAALRTQDLAAAQNDLARLRALVDAAAGLSPGDLKRLSDALPEMKEVLANYVALRNDVEDLRARLLGAEARASELEVRVLEAARAVADLQSALSRLAGQNRDLAERVARLESTLFQRLDERYLTVERFQGVVEPLSQRLREAETRLDRVEEQLNGTQRLLDPNAPRLESLRLRAGAG